MCENRSHENNPNWRFQLYVISLLLQKGDTSCSDWAISSYMRILSASAIHEGAIRCPVWNTSHTAGFMIHVRGDATLTIGPYGSAGTCIINDAPPQITVVVMTLVIVWLFVTISSIRHNQRCVTIDSVIPAQSTAHSSNKRHRIELM